MTRLEIAARIAAGLATNTDLLVPIIAEYSLLIADELIKLEAETRPKPEHKPEQELPFEMVVGGVYEDRDGREEEIIFKDKDINYPFCGKSGRFYTKEGIF